MWGGLAGGVQITAGSEVSTKCKRDSRTFGDEQRAVVHIREEETENFKALIHKIWRRFRQWPIKMRRSRSGFQIDASANR
jgi:hypothetical protein